MEILKYVKIQSQSIVSGTRVVMAGVFFFKREKREGTMWLWRAFLIKGGKMGRFLDSGCVLDKREENAFFIYDCHFSIVQ